MHKISVIVPVYKVEKYLERCVDSILNNDYTGEYEIILVNDGSPDNSQVIIDQYCVKFPKKVVGLIKENGGLSSARNFGIDNATGNFVSFVDSDDYVEKNYLRELVDKQKQTNADIVVCGYKRIDLINSKKTKDIFFEFNSEDELKAYSNTPAWNKLYRKSLIVENDVKFRGKMGNEDLVFNMELAQYAKSYAQIPKALINYIYIWDDERVSITDNPNYFHGIMDLSKDILTFNKLNRDILEYCIMSNVLIFPFQLSLKNTKLRKKFFNEATVYKEFINLKNPYIGYYPTIGLKNKFFTKIILKIIDWKI